MEVENKTITVFCSSSNAVNEDFKRDAQQVGEYLAKHHCRLLFGGSAMGLMRIVADAALDGGADVLGVMPEFMKSVEWNYKRLSEDQLQWTQTMAERKEVLISNADAIIVLPGAVGTLEELAEALSLKRLGRFFAPIVIVNTNGFYDTLLQWLNHTVNEHLMQDSHREMWYVATCVDAAFQYIEQAKEWPKDAAKFATR